MAEKQNFIGGLIVGKVIEKVVEKALDRVAASPNTDMQKRDVPVATEIVTREVNREVKSMVDHVTDNEPFYKSRNVWASFVGVITAIDIIQRQWFDGLPNDVNDYLTPIGVVVAALTPLYSRYIAKKPLGE